MNNQDDDFLEAIEGYPKELQEQIKLGKALSRNLADVAIKYMDETKIEGIHVMMGVSAFVGAIIPLIAIDPKKGVEEFCKMMLLGSKHLYGDEDGGKKNHEPMDVPS